MRWPLRQVFELLRNGFPALGTAFVTPLTLTVPQACVVTWLGVIDTWLASAWPLALAVAPGKIMASDARLPTPRRPAGNRKRLLIVFLSGAGTPRIPT